MYITEIKLFPKDFLVKKLQKILRSYDIGANTTF